MPRLAVIGYPVGHSRSPAMQNAALAELGLSGEWSYEAIEAEPAEFEAKVREMAAGDFAGANITVPHKEAALALADTPSESAREIGAANTLVFRNGRIEARNTDARGLLAALPASPRGRRTLVLGAGGAARAAVWALIAEGAAVEVWNRTASRAEAICTELGGTPVADPDQGTYELIVNTSTAGLGGEDPFEQLPLRPEAFASGQTVLDMVYGDQPSRLLAAAERAGATVVDGLEVLVQQGALSLEIWTGREPPIEVMRAAAASG
jgi:shikimate dehydrogenase